MRWTLLKLVLRVLLLSACGGAIAPNPDNDPGPPCAIGAWASCRCVDSMADSSGGNGDIGTKRCIDGTRFTACACDPVCVYPAGDANQPACPPAFSEAYLGTKCPESSLVCNYPGEGNPPGPGGGCYYGTATLKCAAAPGGEAIWVGSR